MQGEKDLQKAEFREIVENLDIDKIKAFLNKYPFFRDHVSETSGYTPLMWACYKNSIPLVLFLLSKGADINSSKKGGCTLLTMASKKNYVELMKTLLDEGAALDLIDNHGYTALEWASERSHSECVSILNEHRNSVLTSDNDGKMLIDAPEDNGIVEDGNSQNLFTSGGSEEELTEISKELDKLEQQPSQAEQQSDEPIQVPDSFVSRLRLVSGSSKNFPSSL